MKLTELERIHVGYLDTPLEYMPNLTKELGKGKLYVKRDDMTGLAFGGNKARKLDYLVKDALDHGYNALMTFGGVQTNHGRMTVAAAVRYNMKPILVLTGPKPDYCSGNLILDRMMGADVHFIDTTAYADLPEPEKSEKTAAFLAQETEKIVAEYEKQGIHPYNVPVGGSSLVGAAGYINAIPEIMKQMKEQGIEAKYLVCGYGSMGTFGGLLAGAKYFKAPFEVIGIPVSPAYRSPEQVAEFIDKLSAEYELGIHVTPEEVRIETGTPEEPYYGIAYNVPDPVTQQYMALLARTEGLFTDPCYTGKIFHGFVDLVRSGKIPRVKTPSSCTRAVHRQSGARSIWMRLRRSSMTAKACSYTRHKTLKFPGTLSPVTKNMGPEKRVPYFLPFSAPAAGIQADMAQGFRNPAFRTGRGGGVPG